MKKAATVFLLLSLLFSCKKETYPDLKGNYDWAWSEPIYSTGTDLTDLSGSIDRYGFRIKENGKVLFYKNGKFQFNAQITALNEFYGGESTTITRNGTSYILSLHKDEIYLTDYPFEGCYNYYKK